MRSRTPIEEAHGIVSAAHACLSSLRMTIAGETVADARLRAALGGHMADIGRLSNAILERRSIAPIDAAAIAAVRGAFAKVGDALAAELERVAAGSSAGGGTGSPDEAA